MGKDFKNYYSERKNAKNEEPLNASNVKNKVSPDNMKLIESMLKKYSGKGQEQLLKDIVKMATERKKQGKLTNAEIDKFVSSISTMLDEEKRKELIKLAETLKGQTP